MNATPHEPKPSSSADDTQAKADRTRDDAREREPRHDRSGRIGAAQLAAPSTRRWRRAGRFDATR
ncbi:MAG: hypothetical protein QOG94_2658 [Solirubrobacteraceae bacterium]|jgi:hypothetical protein|nr:hypothetical protein [Solirubrobacteraceae bacterium]MEA2139425.1 hypothetical protein [Solirubrobacteraceae bacterium]